jgi:sialic acid synthase SpsE/mannose-6-phosphate isomerase-like protein (cupin superfamily)
MKQINNLGTFYIFEMANNHMGSVEHAKKIIDAFSDLAKRRKINAAIKLQFRNLDTFIHKDYQASDLKFVKRFNETRLTHNQFKEIVEYIHAAGMVSMATPFDNESLHMFDDLGVQMLKIASCSVDDWPLLNEASTINRKIVISTGGATIKTLKRVYNIFKKAGRDFSYMHCIAEYPTPIDKSFLNRITKLKEEFPDIEIGFSTHESPKQKSMVPYAIALGCALVEKHVGVPTDTIKLNEYSCTVEDFEKVLDEVELLESAMKGEFTTSQALQELKRGIYSKRPIKKGDIVTANDFYYAMPVLDGCMDVSMIDTILNTTAMIDINNDIPIKHEYFHDINKTLTIIDIISKANEMLSASNITVTAKDDVELSCHYGLDNFYETGALIISKINRAYCKKIILMLPNQSHPTHRHIQKEECFELLSGDCTLVLNGRSIELKKGDTILINRNVSHSFFSKNGCVIEEISTTHIKGDSIYDDPRINKLSVDERKIQIQL